MRIKKLVDTINRTYVMSEYLRQPDVYYYMDRVIDDINEQLQSCYPTFSEWEDYVEEYNKQFGPLPEPEEAHEDCPPGQPHMPEFPGHIHKPTPPAHYIHHFPPRKPKDRTVYDVIPDKYLRSVVALGAALYFFENDEEGEQIALDYQQRYQQQLFYMVRDFHALVPPEFQNNTGGFIDFSYERERGPLGLHPRGVVMRGKDNEVL